jgi:hypothetical protein
VLPWGPTETIERIQLGQQKAQNENVRRTQTKNTKEG